MTLAKINQQTALIDALRASLASAEEELVVSVGLYLTERGGVRKNARQMNFSPAYVSDVINGRRKISAEFANRLDYCEET